MDEQNRVSAAAPERYGRNEGDDVEAHRKALARDAEQPPSADEHDKRSAAHSSDRDDDVEAHRRVL